MLAIYLCDDQKETLQLHKEMISKFLLLRDWDTSLSFCGDHPQELLEHLKNSHDTGLYFLDIDLKNPSMNGMDLAEEIRNIDPRGFIVFITAFEEYRQKVFEKELEALNYIIKEEPSKVDAAICHCIEKAYKRYKSGIPFTEKTLKLQVMDTIRFVPMNNIVAIQSSFKSNCIDIHTDTGKITYTDTLKHIQSELDERFLKVHKSCIINKDKINCIDKKDMVVYMTNGLGCPLSYRQVKKFLNKNSLY